MPKVSVLVPIFNVEEYLGKCLDSVVGQTLKDIEIICINDGSTDRSLDIIKRYAVRDPRIVIIDKPNSGYGDSMNKGLERATGEYIGIVESDDWAEPDMFEQLYKLAKENDADVVKSNFYNYFQDPAKQSKSGTIAYLVSPHQVGRVVTVAEEPDIFFQRPAIWSGIYRRAFLLDNTIDFLPSPGASYQDTGFAFKVWAEAKRSIFTSEPFLHYRQDNESSSVASPGKVFCVADEYSEIKRYLQERGIFDELSDVYTVARWGSYAWNIQRLEPTLAGEFIDFVSEQLKTENSSGELDLSMCDVNQRRGMHELMDRPDMAKLRRRSQASARVSVVVPVHDTEQYLQECIDSVLDQTITSLELLLIDDGSVDGSIDILEQAYETDPRVRLVSINHVGQAAARNVALDMAQAPFLTFVDSDDYLERDALERLLDAVEQSKSQLALGTINPVFESNTRTAVQRVQDRQYYKLRAEGTHDLDARVMGKVDMSVCNKIFVRELVEDLNLRFPVDLKFEDAYFVNAYAWNINKVTFLDPEAPIYNYRRRLGSTMSTAFSGSPSAGDHMEVAFRLLSRLEEAKYGSRFGHYYMIFLRDSVNFAFNFSPRDRYRELWRKLAGWVSYNYDTLRSLDPTVARQLRDMVPLSERRHFVGSSAQSWPRRVGNKASRIGRDIAWKVLPSYRSAATIIRDLTRLQEKTELTLNSLDAVSSQTHRDIQSLTSSLKRDV